MGASGFAGASWRVAGGSLRAPCPSALAAEAAAGDGASVRAMGVVAFGACRYIDPQGRELWISKAGPWAPRVLKWGPDLIPQPGMLVRRSAWSAVGGLDAFEDLVAQPLEEAPDQRAAE